jgi:hypothetical protein
MSEQVVVLGGIVIFGAAFLALAFIIVMDSISRPFSGYLGLIVYMKKARNALFMVADKLDGVEASDPSSSVNSVNKEKVSEDTRLVSK